MKERSDRIFIHGNIYTMEAEGVRRDALVVRDGKFLYVGNTQEALANYDGEVIDLEGKTVLPGMGDSHLHFVAFCQTYTTVDLGDCTSKKEAVERLAAKAAETPEGEWIKGSNFDQSKWTDSADVLPTRFDLDKASARHPIVIKRVCLHTAVANTLALEKAHIGKGYVYGEGGLVVLDENGMPNGIFREQASRIYDDLIPDPFLVPEIKKKYMKMGFDLAARYGITMMHTYAAEIWKYSENINEYIALERQGKLPVRMTICLDYFYDKPFVTRAEREDPFRLCQFGSFKTFCDGSLGSRSAKLYAPYDDDPSTDGILVMTQEELNERICEGYRRGLQPAIHCIGDKGLDCVLTAIEYTLQKTAEEGMSAREQKDRLPFRIIHAQMATSELVERLCKLPVILDIQPSFLLTDMHWIEERVGERASYSYTWKTFLDYGLVMAGGSDSPVESFSPWNGIYSLVTRKDLNGRPDGGYRPEEGIDRYNAVLMYCKNIAIANGEEDLLGTIENDKFADMVVIDRDIFKIPAEQIKDIQVLATYLAGNATYRVEQ